MLEQRVLMDVIEHNVANHPKPHHMNRDLMTTLLQLEQKMKRYKIEIENQVIGEVAYDERLLQKDKAGLVGTLSQELSISERFIKIKDILVSEQASAIIGMALCMGVLFICLMGGIA